MKNVHVMAISQQEDGFSLNKVHTLNYEYPHSFVFLRK